MIQVPGWVVVAVMVVHAVLAYLTSQTEVRLEPIWNVAVGAALVALNVISNAVKPLTTALRTMTRRGQ